MEDIRNLFITEVQWNGVLTFGLTLNNGESCKAGTKLDFDSSHSFDPAKKISKVETIIENDEDTIL